MTKPLFNLSRVQLDDNPALRKVLIDLLSDDPATRDSTEIAIMDVLREPILNALRLEAKEAIGS